MGTIITQKKSVHRIVQALRKTHITMIGASVPLLEPEYQAVLNRITALGYTLPSTGQQTKQNQLVRDLKGFGIWSLLDMLKIFSTDAGHLSAQIDWINPTLYQASENNSNTFTNSVGFGLTSNLSYIDSGWTASLNSVNYALDDASFFAHASVWPGVVNADPAILCADGNGGMAKNGVSMYYAINNTGTNSGSMSLAAGFWMVQQKTGNKSLFKNGAQVRSVANVGTTKSSTAFRVGIGLGQPGNGCTYNMIGAGAGLAGKEANLYTAWNTYLTSLP